MLLTLFAVAVGFAGGVALSLWVLRGRAVRGTLPVAGTPVALDVPAETPPPTVQAIEPEKQTPEPSDEKSPHLVALLGDALRSPLNRLRRTSAPADVVEAFERVSWQARMLTSRGRPLQGQPTSPIALLQEAAEKVELLRLGKVGASWSLLTRTPVHLDPERAASAFRELLTAAAQAAGEGGRISVRIHEGAEEGFPVCVEIGIARRGAAPDPLAFLVGKRLLDAQGARVSLDGGVTSIDLRSIAPESDADPAA